MGFNVRCTWRRGCGKHFTLRKHPDSYKRYPRCPACKRGHLNLAPYSKEMTQRRTCYCKGIRFPHKRGAFINANEICHEAEVEDLGDGPIKCVSMRPDEDCPF